MCLIAIAHDVSEKYPLVIAANRDEAYDRPALDADFWEDAPDVIGGRDAVHGGSWLAVSRFGRFAAVTNLTGAVPRARSRGLLVREFVTGREGAGEFAARVARDAEQYAGFHLLAGDAGSDVMYISPDVQRPLSRGIHGISNAPDGEEWPKVTVAVRSMKDAVAAAASPEDVMDRLMRLLSTSGSSGTVQSEVFITGGQYGTRASTVIVIAENGVLFAEQSYGRGGHPIADRRTFHMQRK